MRDDPETIEKKRRARQLKKEIQATQPTLSQSASVSDVNEHGFSTQFVHRKFLSLTDPAASKSAGLDRGDVGLSKKEDLNDTPVPFRLLTYNILAQSLVRRKLFPSSGEALKWKNRQHVLQRELQYYDADIMCLQEVGIDMLTPCLQKFFTNHGYKYEFHTGVGKLHGVMIVYRPRRFAILHKRTIDYDDLDQQSTTGLRDQQETLPKSNNVGLVCILRDLVSNIDFTLGTTHLFWHPRGTYERARQMQLLVALSNQVSRELGTQDRIILAGDLNTEPLDPTYLALTERPYTTNALGRQIMQESCGQLNIESEDSGLDMAASKATQAVPGLEGKWQGRLDKLSQGPQLRSLYAQHYHQVDPRNCGPNGEPLCTNFAHVYRGTLDYVLTPVESPLTCIALLRMPDIRLLSQGQPQEGQFPSDHFALGCEVYLRQ